MLTKIESSFEGENIQIKYSVLGYRIHLRFHGNNLATEIDENGQIDRNIYCEMKRQKAIESIITRELRCMR